MLILSRCFQEKIIIREDITVKVLEIDADKVRLGITAPKDIPIRRGRKNQESNN